ncbi:acyltransferase family protein [Leptothermofonsia sp. ETS-13]|uniref:acyltransferase family protein n=1 Tax=Leptothermofonsia sp. ETS-13 TaxID=3035696 RepID=UPI003BA1D41C
MNDVFRNYILEEKILLENPIFLHLSLIAVFSILLLSTLRKSSAEKPLSIQQTNQAKGLAIIIVIIHHICVFVLNDPTPLLPLCRIGFVGVSVFLILSGFGLAISLERNGVNQFFYKRFIRVYLPYVLATLLELGLRYSLLQQQPKLIDVASLLGITNVDRTMWFIQFILFWYCILYLIYKLSFSQSIKIVALFFVSLLLIANPQVPDRNWYVNIFSFPVGYWLGLHAKSLTYQIGLLLNRRRPMIFLVVGLSFFSLAAFAYKEHILFSLSIYLIASLIITLYLFQSTKRAVSIISLDSFLREEMNWFNFETACFLFLIVILYFGYFGLPLRPEFSKDVLYSIFAVFSGLGIVATISLLAKWNLYSQFLDFIGGISFELYLFHGMFMYTFDLILFRGNLAITFFIYFGFICLISILFQKLMACLFKLIPPSWATRR